MFSFTAILSRRRTRHLGVQWQLRAGLLYNAKFTSIDQGRSQAPDLGGGRRGRGCITFEKN